MDGCKSLQFLNLEGNTLGVDAARAIGKALEKHPEFKQALFKDLFTGRLKTEIPEALQLMGKGMITAGAQLTVFDCSDNALGPNGMVGLVELFKSPSCYSLQVKGFIIFRFFPLSIFEEILSLDYHFVLTIGIEIEQLWLGHWWR